MCVCVCVCVCVYNFIPYALTHNTHQYTHVKNAGPQGNSCRNMVDLPHTGRPALGQAVAAFWTPYNHTPTSVRRSATPSNRHFLLPRKHYY